MKAAFITHAGPDIGGGHLSRCFALSRALGRFGVESVWIVNEGARSQAAALGVVGAVYLGDPFSDEILPLVDGVDFAVADSYIPGEVFYEKISKRTKLVVIDDLNDRGVERFASVVINYGVGARREFYRDDRCLYLIGPMYAPLREDYWDVVPRTGDYVLFAPGAADVLGCAETAARWWRGDMERIVIILGALAPAERCKNALAAASGKKNVEISPSPDGFAGILAGASIVICSAGVTAYESLALEKRTAIFSVADNQIGLGKLLADMGAAYDMGEWGSVTPATLAAAVRFIPSEGILRGLVDKRGAISCAAEILSFLGVTG